MTGSRRACLDVPTYLIGVWLRANGMAQSSLGNSFALGTLAGFAIFEKLSLFVLLLPLALFLFQKIADRYILSPLRSSQSEQSKWGPKPKQKPGLSHYFPSFKKQSSNIAE